MEQEMLLRKMRQSIYDDYNQCRLSNICELNVSLPIELHDDSVTKLIKELLSAFPGIGYYSGDDYDRNTVWTKMNANCPIRNFKIILKPK
jgi:hypothetical protein